MSEFMQQFCSDHRGATEKPAAFGNWLYACDGHLLVRIPTHGPATLDSNFGRLYEEAFADFPDPRSLSGAAPAHASIVAALCKGCGGGTREPVAVDEGLDCAECGGIGSDVHVTDRIDGVKVSAAYSVKVRGLPGVRVRGGFRRSMTAVFFAFNGGGQGILMGLKE